MANTLEYAKIFQTELDAQMVAGATSGWMELNDNQVKYNGGNEVKIPSVVMDGLADYDRDAGFTKGSVTLSYQTHQLTQDRGRTFSLDAMDIDETNFVATAGMVLGEFQRTKVIPEVDAYRYSKIASLAIAGSKASGGYTAATNDILAKLVADIYQVYDAVGEGVPLVITMNMGIAAMLDTADKLEKKLDVMDFTQGNVSLKLKSIDGIPIIKVPSTRMKTAYVFNDGATAGQEAGGFVADGTAKDINWIISARNSVIAISKTDNPRIFDPQTNQQADAWKVDYRKYHDLWIPTNKLTGVFVNVKQAL
ncbi:hypothetical protein [Desulforamulus aeronauticus]|uniref:Phage major capsid protein, HK97 family n=1 Tax=Desulforamulus aeronauticus DSM 10349 TaxID=1121421 RepID=A0A1M6SCC8_9FIRM|nr:hypothetical protein [Desulforamulus aeronauticus]SHK42187.1 hypothetical protein SAMN02745123_01793 [Desulforamulus aeronauticus DSM 10349]